jgi:hypothetical protein
MAFEYDERARTAVTQSVRHEFIVTVGGRALDVESATLDFDEGNSPHVTFTATCKVPEDQAFLDSLDPRLYPRVLVSLGYRYAGGDVDLPQVANLSLTSRTVTRPNNTMSIVADSDEIIISEYGRSTDWDFGITYNPVTAIQSLLQYGSFGSTVSVSVEATRPDITEEEAFIVEAGSDHMATVFDIADRASDLWVYDDGTRKFHIRDRAKLGKSAHNLTVGANGTIFTSSTTMSRENWANVTFVRHKWQTEAGNEKKRTGVAIASGFNFSAGRRMMTIDRDRPASAESAKKSADSILKRTLSRGRTFELEAHSAYWLRPGDTVTVTLPTGGQERHLVASVRFYVPEGRMFLTTRLPQDVEIT